ncbi:hypothetical protein HY30_08095 [Hyphomonas chukchiensis]|uniref:Uncharacterized protein n=1 Tax=Hyphomonas chukchiensis TaxID=1280947 RepID=A0A062UBL1_9PROT|nr:hypothetical protein HY30_08095 [Hyphomonas chukchiensis]
MDGTLEKEHAGLESQRLATQLSFKQKGADLAFE